MASPHSARFRALFGSAALPLTFTLCSLAAQPAAAQYYNTVGHADPSVIVDTSVLDQLGPPANIGAVPPPDGLTKAPGTAGRRYGYPGPGGAVAPSQTPQSRLLTVPAMPGRPVPKLSGGSTSPSSAAPAPAPKPVMASTPTPMAEPSKQEAPQVAATPSAPPPAPPPAPAVAAAPSAPTQITPPPPPPMPAPMPAPMPVAVTPPPPPPPMPAIITPPAPAIPVPVPSPAATSATMPAPAAAPAPAPAPQVATLPPATTAGAGNRLTFDSGSATLNDSARQALDALAAQLASNEQRLKVVAYAAGQANNVSQARRLSLSRALAVRAYLIDKGIRSTRIDVQAMGTPENGNGPADRVDLSVVAQ